MGEYAHPEVLVSTQWVFEHGRDPRVRLVEVDVDTTAYDQGHIEGAIGWNWQSQLQDSTRRDLIDKRSFEQLLSESGISNEDTVVVYGDNNNWFAAWAFWQLKLYGHPDARIMNGGRRKWLEEKRALTTVAPRIAPAPYRAQEPDATIRATRDLIFAVLGRHHTAHLVDVRSPDEFTGQIIAPPGMTETAQRGGHIPGAKDIPWSQAVREDGTFKPVEELRELYTSRGILPGQEAIAYCRIGERSSHTWFVLKYLLGFQKVRNYDGSWTEWGNLVGAPIEKGVAAAAT